jgi:hypothetical protein
MSKKKEYNSQALIEEVAGLENTFVDCLLDMWEATIQLCPNWKEYCPSGPVEWLYNERPDIARAIEQKHKLYPEGI